MKLCDSRLVFNRNKLQKQKNVVFKKTKITENSNFVTICDSLAVDRKIRSVT